jgi:hypothetical protein
VPVRPSVVLLVTEVVTLVLCSVPVHDVKGSSKIFPKHEARHVSDHKVGVFPCETAFVSVSSCPSESAYYCLHALHFSMERTQLRI